MITSALRNSVIGVYRNSLTILHIRLNFFVHTKFDYNYTTVIKDIFRWILNVTSDCSRAFHNTNQIVIQTKWDYIAHYASSKTKNLKQIL